MLVPVTIDHRPISLSMKYLTAIASSGIHRNIMP